MGDFGGICHELEQVQFRFYLADEIKKISVKEITNPQVFDSLNHPASGGLYDSALGPTDRGDVCLTCGQGIMHCPGHMGHIQLVVPVFNPVYFRTMLQIMKLSCFNCQRIAVTSLDSFVFIQKMKVVKHGLLEIISHIDDIVYSHMTEGKMDDAPLELIKRELSDDVQKRIEKMCQEDGSTSLKNIHCVKNELVTTFLRESARTNTCPHCKTRKKTVRQELNTKIVFGRSVVGNRGKSQKILQRKDESPDSDEDVDKDESLIDESFVMETPAKTSINLEKEGQTFISPVQAREHLYAVWKNDKELLACLYQSLQKSGKDFPVDIFFLDVVPVSPSRFRPMVEHKGQIYGNTQTTNLNNVLSQNVLLTTLIKYLKEAKHGEISESTLPTSISQLQGKTLQEKFSTLWNLLQMYVNVIVDQDLVKIPRFSGPGIKQVIEKKEGLFRKHMMGKRVNFAARSVISPDPSISTNEIGIPEVFAKHLTYTEWVTPWNVQEIRQAVLNGPDVHPGAMYVINEEGQKIMLNGNDKTQRESVAKQLLTINDEITNKNPRGENKKVLRHLKDGDILLLNRQPTLHRPSIQAHKARVLQGERTLRLHYSNCKAYNADFDGDEMNAHFPQNDLARAEAYHLMSTDHQYLTPKDGTPLAGLIQDHMVSGVILSLRGQFFNRQKYCQLVYGAISEDKKKIITLPPCIRKPHKLWSGKQVLSTLILNSVPVGKVALNLDSKSKIPEKSWKERESTSINDMFQKLSEDMGESHVIIRKGELLCGVLDKGHYGPTPYGLVHCCYELYGGGMAGKLLTAFSRVFTFFLQYMKGFTLGVKDILVTNTANFNRTKNIEVSQTFGDGSARETFHLEKDDSNETLLCSLKAAHFNSNGHKMKELDANVKTRNNDVQNNIVKCIMPAGLVEIFPVNNLQLMVQSGAKGSMVNCMQISCLLGQIELEGRRPPLMLSGKTLPSFKAYDTSPRAGGFVSGRFLTGIHPQEYFFHCMAGREGLIDTAVKTSRSGYLQRCLMKHLEGLVVNYDLTVRDSDGSVVQFFYGEDGLDICKSGFLRPSTYPFLIENQQIIGDRIGNILGKNDLKAVKQIKKRIAKNKKKCDNFGSRRSTPFICYSIKEADNIQEIEVGKIGRSKKAWSLCSSWKELDIDSKKRYQKMSVMIPDPVTTVFSPYHSGVLSEKLDDIIIGYSEKLSANEASTISPKSFCKLLYGKARHSLVEPGEAVGPICAQSIGEPSTQMTLNTFHFAGRGEMNVTLGIPRLREILMIGSKLIKTPTMSAPVLQVPGAKEEVKKLQILLNRVLMSEVLEDFEVVEYLAIKGRAKQERCRRYEITLRFLPYHVYKKRLFVNPASIMQFIEKKYIKKLVSIIKKKMTDVTKARLTSVGKIAMQTTTGGLVDKEKTMAIADFDEEEEAGDLNDMTGDDDAAMTKEFKKHQEEQEYDEGGEDPAYDQIIDNEINEEVEEEVEMEEDPKENDVIGFMENENGDNNEFDVTAPNKGDLVQNRIKDVLASSQYIYDYKFDTKKQLWCTVTLQYPVLDSKIDMTSLVEKDSRNAIIHQIQGISQCFLTEESFSEGKQLIKTEGINFQEIFDYFDVLDLNQVYSNDIHEMANIYGIEAAGKVIVKEIQDVFAAYGIIVDYRHLSMLADYMTFEGVYKPFNRMALETSPSPFQQMSFETTMTFLVKAALQGKTDILKNPSSKLVVGQVISSGSGAFDIIQPLDKQF